MTHQSHQLLSKIFIDFDSTLRSLQGLHASECFDSPAQAVVFSQALKRAQAELRAAKALLAEPKNPLLIPTEGEVLKKWQGQAVAEAQLLAGLPDGGT